MAFKLAELKHTAWYNIKHWAEYHVPGWIQNIWFAQGNWKDLVDMHQRFGPVLSEATGGAMSKTNYLKEVMVAEVADFQNQIYDDGARETLIDLKNNIIANGRERWTVKQIVAEIEELEKMH